MKTKYFYSIKIVKHKSIQKLHRKCDICNKLLSANETLFKQVEFRETKINGNVTTTSQNCKPPSYGHEYCLLHNRK